MLASQFSTHQKKHYSGMLLKLSMNIIDGSLSSNFGSSIRFTPDNLNANLIKMINFV